MKETIIPFEEFEKAVMYRLLEEDTPINHVLREQYKRAVIESREFKVTPCVKTQKSYSFRNHILSSPV
jgi:hypothetical protein